MRQSKNKKREVTAALYVRLSRDDNLEGDSYRSRKSEKITNQNCKRKRIYKSLDFLRRRYFRRNNGTPRISCEFDFLKRLRTTRYQPYL